MVHVLFQEELWATAWMIMEELLAYAQLGRLWPKKNTRATEKRLPSEHLWR